MSAHRLGNAICISIIVDSVNMFMIRSFAIFIQKDAMTDAETIDFYQSWILRLLSGLFVRVGFSAEDGSVARLPGTVQRKIGRVLLPLESAARRLIFFAEQRLPATPVVPVKPGPTAKERSTLGYLSKLKKKKRRARSGTRGGTRAAVFWLFDKARYYPHLADPRRRPSRGGPGPRIWLLDGSDLPRATAPVKAPRDDGDTRKLCRRLLALSDALGDVPKQALRMRRLMAARAARSAKPAAPPLRSGAPPGYRYDGKDEAFDVLRGCHRLAQDPDPPPLVQ